MNDLDKTGPNLPTLHGPQSTSLPRFALFEETS